MILMYPHIILQTDIELDAHITRSFIGSSAGGIDFNESVYGPNPELKEVNIEDEAAVRQYFETAYRERREVMKAAITFFQTQWDKVEKAFMSLTSQIFNGHPFPHGEYKGYISITNCNPRFLEDKTFMMFYLATTPNSTISHELMHFIFYDYSLQKFPELFKDADPNSGTYWSLAELFNNVLLSLPEYSFLGTQGDHPYPNHKKIYPVLVDMWNANNDVDKFIRNAYRYILDNQSQLWKLPP